MPKQATFIDSLFTERSRYSPPKKKLRKEEIRRQEALVFFHDYLEFIKEKGFSITESEQRFALAYFLNRHKNNRGRIVLGRCPEWPEHDKTVKTLQLFEDKLKDKDNDKTTIKS